MEKAPRCLLCCLLVLAAGSSTTRAARPPDRPPLVVITDLEPDDNIALQVASAELARRDVIVGTTVKHAGKKAVLARRLLDQLGLHKIPVYQGSGGDVSSYPEFKSLEASRTYEQVGEGVLSTRKLAALERKPASSEAFAKHLEEFLLRQGAQGKKVEIAVLAPPTDLVSVLKKNPKLAKSIGRIHQVMGGWTDSADKPGETTHYATFNWLMDGSAANALFNLVTELNIPTTVFSSHLIKSTFPGGSINRERYPKIVDLMSGYWRLLGISIPKPGAKSLRDLRISSAKWDNHLMDTIPPLENVIGRGNAGKQFTPADPLTMMSLDTPGIVASTERVAIELLLEAPHPQEGYRVEVTKAPNSSIQPVSEIDVDLFAEKMERFLRSLPGQAVRRRLQAMTVQSVQSVGKPFARALKGATAAWKGAFRRR